MRLRNKLITIFLFLAMIPLTISGTILVRILEEQVTDQKDVFRNERLEALARRLDWNLQQVAFNLRLGIETFDLTRLDESERLGILKILYGQRSYLNAIQLLDSQGQPLGPPVRLEGPVDKRGPYAKHVQIFEDELEVLRADSLVQSAQKNGIAWGAPIYVKSALLPQLPLALGFMRDGSAAYLVTALLDLVDAAGADVALQEFSSSEAQDFPGVYLLDGSDRVLVGVDRLRSNTGTLTIPGALLDIMRGRRGGQLEYRLDGADQMVAWYPLESFGWRVMTVQPAADVYRSVHEPMQDTIYWMVVSVIVAVVFGAYFGHTLAAPIRELADGVLEVARGNLDAQVPVRTRDEIGKLAETFNYMAGVLKSQKAEIERQSEEIRSWNLELQARVEARTRELKEAQGYLIHTQKLAAVAELGSGVAHELNNPLAAILGFTQILIARHTRTGPDGQPLEDQELKSLKRIEEQTQRCRDIVHHLLRFSQEQIDRGAYDAVDLTEVVETVLKLFEGSFASRKIVVKTLLKPGELVSWGNRAQLLQAFLQLFSAVRTVLKDGQALTVDGRSDAGEIRVIVAGPLRGLDGSGTGLFQAQGSQDQAMAQGLGLWLARKIFQEHQGGLEIELPSEDTGAGEARLVISMPARASSRLVAREGVLI